MSGALRVLVVDDQQLLRRGLVMLFGTVDGVDVVAQAAHGAEALAVLRAKEIDVVLADAKMPVMDGIELVRRCAREHPGLPVLVLTTFDEPDVVRGAEALRRKLFISRRKGGMLRHRYRPVESIKNAKIATNHGAEYTSYKPRKRKI